MSYETRSELRLPNGNFALLFHLICNISVLTFKVYLILFFKKNWNTIFENFMSRFTCYQHLNTLVIHNKFFRSFLKNDSVFQHRLKNLVAWKELDQQETFSDALTNTEHLKWSQSQTFYERHCQSCQSNLLTIMSQSKERVPVSSLSTKLYTVHIYTLV